MQPLIELAELHFLGLKPHFASLEIYFQLFQLTKLQLVCYISRLNCLNFSFSVFDIEILNLRSLDHLLRFVLVH